MRKSLFLCGAVGLLAAAWPALIRAQFQPLNPDELKMTSDPKAPGADAVYLEWKEIDDDWLNRQTIYARIKVLTEKGKESATIEIPYTMQAERFSEIKGRTIHPDGSVVPLKVKQE